MNEFGDLLGTPYAPVSKIAPVKSLVLHRQITIKISLVVEKPLHSSWKDYAHQEKVLQVSNF